MVHDGDQVSAAYSFVPFPEQHARGLEPAGHHIVFVKGRVSGEIRAVLFALTPIHIGSGRERLRSDSAPPIVKGAMRSWVRNPQSDGGSARTGANRLIIPGMSIKGAVRSVFEAITGSCVCISKAGGVDRACVSREHQRDLCPACRVFGAMGYQGNLHFSDAVPARDKETGKPQVTVRVAALPHMWPPVSTSDRYNPIQGRKFYRHGRLRSGPVPVEVADKGSRFDVRIGFEALTESELGCLLLALGAKRPSTGNRILLKLGGIKCACCGSAQFIEMGARLWTEQDWLAFDRAPQPMTAEDYGRYLAAAEELLSDGGAQFERLAEIMDFPRDLNQLELCGYEEAAP
ncbi:MAG: hypothetical protein HPY44_18900 [Armatimonadetes bacterium]|nr:hypothetical protein [Armatimonadota bacterium]